MAFARHQFELSKPVGADGGTVREHLELVAERTGELPVELMDAPECPPSTELLWADFLHLHQERESNGFELRRITSRNIVDWQTLHGVKLSAWEIAQIQAIDTMWLNEFAPKVEEKAE